LRCIATWGRLTPHHSLSALPLITTHKPSLKSLHVAHTIRSGYCLTVFTADTLRYAVTVTFDLWPWTRGCGQTLKSSNPRQSYSDLNIWPNDLEHVSRFALGPGIFSLNLSSVNLSVSDISYVTLWPRSLTPLTLNVCGTSCVTWSQSVFNFSEIEQSPAEILATGQIFAPYITPWPWPLTHWPWTCVVDRVKFNKTCYFLPVHHVKMNVCVSWGYYGDDCSQRCPTPCASGSCHRQFGFCQCAAGLFGPTCRLPCPVGLWGSNCVKPCRCHQRSATGCDARVTLTLILIVLLSK